MFMGGHGGTDTVVQLHYCLRREGNFLCGVCVFSWRSHGFLPTPKYLHLNVGLILKG